jgi:hypothetical protein
MPIAQMVDSFSAIEVNNFLSQYEIDTILEFVKNTNVWEKTDSEFWNNRSITARNVYNSGNVEIGKMLYDIRERMSSVIVEKYNIDAIYPDLFQIIRWFDGMEQQPHADDMKNAGPGHEWFHHRDFGAIIYLNEDYSGGKTYYPQHNIEITPQSGKLAVHPGDSNHIHGVTKISDGIRYTIASFWTKDREYFDGWTIH